MKHGACGTCYSKKTACDGARPCGRCYRLGLQDCRDRTEAQVNARKMQKLKRRRLREFQSGEEVLQSRREDVVRPKVVAGSSSAVAVATPNRAEECKMGPQGLDSEEVLNIAVFVRTLMRHAPIFLPRTVKPELQLSFQMLLNHLAALPIHVEVLPYMYKILPRLLQRDESLAEFTRNEVIALRALVYFRLRQLPEAAQKVRYDRHKDLLRHIKLVAAPMTRKKCISVYPLFAALDRKVLMNKAMAEIMYPFHPPADMGDGWHVVDFMAFPLMDEQLMFWKGTVVELIMKDVFTPRQVNIPETHPLHSLSPVVTMMKIPVDGTDVPLALIILQMNLPTEVPKWRSLEHFRQALREFGPCAPALDPTFTLEQFLDEKLPDPPEDEPDSSLCFSNDVYPQGPRATGQMIMQQWETQDRQLELRDSKPRPLLLTRDPAHTPSVASSDTQDRTPSPVVRKSTASAFSNIHTRATHRRDDSPMMTDEEKAVEHDPASAAELRLLSVSEMQRLQAVHAQACLQLANMSDQLPQLPRITGPIHLFTPGAGTGRGAHTNVD